MQKYKIVRKHRILYFMTIPSMTAAKLKFYQNILRKPLSLKLGLNFSTDKKGKYNFIKQGRRRTTPLSAIKGKLKKLNLV